MNFYIFTVFPALLAFVKGSNPYYYTPPQLQYQLPVPQINYPTFNTIANPFAPRSYFVNPHFQYRTSFYNPFVPQIQAPFPQIPQIPQAPQEKSYESPQPPTDYQGFAYHTRSNDGATSHVLFVSGPQSQTLRSTLFPSFQGRSQSQTTENPQTFASDMVDPLNKQTTEATPLPKSIQEIYTPPVTITPLVQQVADPGQFFRSFFERSEPSVVNFYSRNSNLFVRPEQGLPANTFPLARSSERFGGELINPRFDDSTEAVTTTTTTTTTTEKSENIEAQQSVITNTRFRINEVIEQVEKLTATTSSMAPIVVEEASSTMAPIVVEETTIPSTTTTTTTTTTPTTTTTEEVTTEEITTDKATTDDLMKTLVNFLTQDLTTTESSTESKEASETSDLLKQVEEVPQTTDVSTQPKEDVSTDPNMSNTSEMSDTSNTTTEST